MPGSASREPAILTDPQAASAPSSAVQADEIELMRELTEQARIAFEAARVAFLRLEAAHHEGLPGTKENARFRAEVAQFRKAAQAVHRAATERRDGRTVWGMAAGRADIERTAVSS